MKKKNVLMMAMSLVLVAVIAVGGTLAYLTSNTKTLTNTFTVGGGYPVGDDTFYLDETDMKDDGTNPGMIDLKDRERARNEYAKMTVGDAVAKDPTFHLTAGPESYVFAKVTGVDEMIAAGFIVSNEAPTDGKNTDTMTNGLNTTNWVKIANLDMTEDNLASTRNGYYVYKVAEDDYTVTPSKTALERLFASVSIDKDAITLPTLTDLNDTIVIKGIAMQADNLETYQLAWTALKGQEQSSNAFFQ